jgi:sugar lactone lactonase YvrE
MRAWVWVLVGCGGSTLPSEDSASPDVCGGSISPGTVEILATGFSKTEGLAFSPDGRLFVSAGDLIAEIQPDGSWSEVVALEGGVGLAWWGDRLVAAGYPGGVGSVVSIDVDQGTMDVLTDQIEAPNFPTVTPWGSLLVSDARSAIHELHGDGGVAVWLEIPGPNGTVFTPAGDTLWAVNTWDDPAPVWQIDVEGNTAGVPREVHAYAGGNFPDGVALGASGDLYVSLNITGRISRVSAEGAETVVAEGVDWTASIAFGVGEGWDRCSVYSTSLFGPDVYRIGVGEPGQGLP